MPASLIIAALQDPVLAISQTRFRFPWIWDGKPAVIQSRYTPEALVRFKKRKATSGSQSVRAPPRVFVNSVELIIQRLGFDPLGKGTLRIALVVRLVVVHPLLNKFPLLAIPDG